MASRKNWSLLLTGLLTVGVILIGCPNPNNPESSTGKATERYATVPYEPAAGTSAAADDLRKLIYSGYEGGTSADTADSYYYVFLLGHINKVPMAYRQAIEYNGTTPITIGYARTESTETSVTETLETATEHSVERGGEIGWEAGIESTIKVKEVFEQKISASVSGSQSWNESTTRSTSRSYETMTAKMNESSDTIEATIGEHDEAAGKYRYSYFATTDVYYVLKTDKSKQVVGGYFAVCARGNSFAWGIDYEPDLGGDFGKTGAGALLKVPAIVNTPSSLPTPENENDLNQIPVGTPAAMPVSDQPTGTEFTGAAQINLSSGTVGAKIHYTISTNGTAPADPTAADLEQPSSGIPLPAAASQVADTVYIIKAIAVKEAMTNSPVATFTYTMKAATLRTVFSREVSGSENNKQVDDDKSFPWLTYCGDDQEPDGLDLDELKAKGYKTIHIALDFDIQEHDYAWGYVAVYSGHITSNGAGFNGGVRLTNTWRFEPDGGWKAYNCSFDIALASFTKDFSIGWTADGVSSDRYNLGRRKYTITALK